MKRLLAVALGICIVGSVLAQSSFTIVRPADGSKVREKIRVMIPKNSLDPGSYVGVFLNGKFVEAVVPPVEGNYRVYTLNTKTPTSMFPTGIPDGEMKLELVKYEGGDTPRIADRSSVTVTVGNQMNITIPAGGIKLRYGFTPGQQLVYNVHEIATVSTLSGVGNQNGGRPASFPASELSFRLLYAIDNTYSNGDALLRMQNLPDKGKDYAILALVGEPDLRQVFDNQMQPVYMRINASARPVFGAVPDYFGFSRGSTPEGGEVVFGSWPLPVLPEKAVAPGSNWRAAYMIPVLDTSSDVHLTNKVSEAYDARGDFVAAEWELGHPCAKIRNSIAAGTRSFTGDQLAKAGKPFADDKVALDETIFFSLDTHKILKLVRTIQIDHKVTIAAPGSGGGPGGPSGPGGTGPGGRGAAPGGVGGPGAPGAAGLGVQRPGPNGRGGGPGPGAVPGGGGGGNGAGQGGTNRGGGGGGAPRTQYIRQTFQQTFTLEQ